MSIEVLIFDWSGVISDDRRPVYEANVRVLKDYGKPVMTFEEWLPRTTMTPIEIFRNHGVQDDPKKLFALYKKYLDEAVRNGSRPKAYPDARSVLRFLHDNGKMICVLSSHPAENLIEEARSYNLLPFLGMISGSSKDKVSGLLDICRQIGKSPSAALYVGDMVFDIRAAKGAGVHSAGICTGYHVKERLEKEEPEFLLESLSDMKAIV